MENRKDPLKFEIVQDTMFFPLYGRALCSQNPKYKFKDEQAEAIVNKLGVNLSEISNYYSELKQLGMAGRAETYDTLIKKYLKGFPNATVVNIGAGLDTTFSRIDNGKIKWYDLDLPDAIETRRKHISETERSKCILKSVFDYTWFDDVYFEPKNGVFLFAAGLLPHLEQNKVKELFQKLPAKFVDGEMAFDVVSERGMKLINKRIQKAKKKGINVDIEIQSFYNNGAQICQYDDRIQLVEEFPFYSRVSHNPKWKFSTKLVIFFNSKIKLSKFIHIKFGK